MVAAAYAVALDARLAGILLTINDRHALNTLRPIAVVAPGCEQPSDVVVRTTAGKAEQEKVDGDLQQAAGSRAK